MVAAVVVTGVAERSSGAADEDEWQISGRAGVSRVSADGRNPGGLRVQIDGLYGLSDAWALRVAGSASYHLIGADMKAGLPAGTASTYGLHAGVNYTLDVLRLLPFFEVAVGVFAVRGQVVDPSTALGMQVGVGAEYLLDPRLGLGAVAEYVYSPFDLLSGALRGTGPPQAFSLSARISWILH